MCQYPDIYFDPRYARLYAQEPGQSVQEFVFENEKGKIVNLFIKRQIDVLIEDKHYVDIITPYGYGGPRIEKIEEGFDAESLVDDYAKAFQQYAQQEGIVSEFVRFHPWATDAVKFDKVFDIVRSRNTVGTNLTLDNAYLVEVAPKTRKKIRHILSNENIWYEIDDNPQTLDDFMRVYYSTMDRNSADEKYYFNKEYFDIHLQDLKDHLLVIRVYYADVIVAMGLYYRYNDVLHVHLSGTMQEYLQYSPAYILRHALIEYGTKNKYRLIHHGGGRTSDPQDTLYKFKKQFGVNTSFDFYIGKKIWNMDAYEKLCWAEKVDLQEEFFPAYRVKIDCTEHAKSVE